MTSGKITDTQKTITPKQIAETLDIPYHRALEIVRAGGVKSQKAKGKYIIFEKDFILFSRANKRKIEAVRREYINLYWQGLGIKQLTARAKEDFYERNIIYSKVNDFAETTIYNHLMEGKRKKENATDVY